MERLSAKNLVAAYAWVKAAQMAGDPRGNDLLHSLKKVLSEKQLAEASEQAMKLQQAQVQLSSTSFAP